MKTLKLWILKKLINEKDIYSIAGNIASRFFDIDSGNHDDLQEKMWSWIRFGLYNKFDK